VERARVVTVGETGGGPTGVTRGQVLRYRVHAQQLDRTPTTERLVTDADVLDLGVQDSGTGGSVWALANRGLEISADPARWPSELTLAWTLRGAPHAYRRSDLMGVEVAVRPFSEADAGRRIYDANKPLKAAGIPATKALETVATELRRIVAAPTAKGAASTALTAAVDEPYLRWCRPCGATHLFEMPFRLAALHGGLELEPGTSPPALRRIPAWPEDHVADLTAAPAPDRLDPVRAYLHLLGPATPAHVASFLDAPLAYVEARWPSDAREVDLDGARRWLLRGDLAELAAVAATPEDAGPVRLLGPFDLFLQARDRDLLVPGTGRHRGLWPTLGRPGAVLAGAEIVGTWRPRASGRRLRILLDPWVPWGEPLCDAVAEQSARYAEHRGLDLEAVAR